MPESIGCDDGVGGDDEGDQADDGEGGDEDGGGGRDGSLHQGAVNVGVRDYSYWGKYSKKECQYKLLVTIPSGILVEEDIVAQDNDDDKGYWADHIVAQESSAHCQCKGSEDHMGGEEEGCLDRFDKCWLL